MTSDTIDNGVTMSGASGTLLAGRYRIVKQLGKGGMGSVWLAEDTQLDNKQFAIKMLPSILVSNKRAYRQLKDEALVAMKLTHPNIVTLRAFEENSGNPFLVMDYVDGETLDDYLADAGNGETGIGNRESGCGGGVSPSRNGGDAIATSGLTESEVIRLLKPIAAALDYAHSQGVVHRDVKPANIMIRKDGTPFILDFGIAREMQETMTRVTGKLSSGTLLYMSPEQLRGLPPKRAQDVYSFAAMAYECLSGHPPFYRGAIEDQIKNEQPEPLPGGPRSCAAAIMSGLAKKPEDRPPSCSAVLGGNFSRVEHVERVDVGDGRARSPSAPPVGSRVPRDRDGDLQVSSGVPPSHSADGADVGPKQAAIKARVEAKIRERRIGELPDENGFAERKRALVDDMFRAEMYFESGVWTDAAAKFSAYAKSCDALVLLAKDMRNKAREEAERKAREEAERKWREEALQNGTSLETGICRTIILPGGAKMEMVYCPPGEFMMGSPKAEEGRCDNETQHNVRLTKGFWLGKYPITQTQWKSVMSGNPSEFKGDDLPVENVSWDDCQEFVKKVNSALGCGARLPTEAEWEYACRAGTTTAYYWGNALNGDKANCDGNCPSGTKEKGPYLGKTSPVGRYSPNPWGLYDMHGNVFEWCLDWYGDYPSCRVVDPTGRASGARRVLRGGSWNDFARFCRSANRDWYAPVLRSRSYGFRLCCSAGPRE